MEARRRHRLTPAGRAAPALIAGLIAICAVAGYWAAASGARRTRDRGVAELAAAEAAAVQANLRNHGQALVATAIALGGSAYPSGVLRATLKQQSAATGVAAIGVATVTGATVTLQQIAPSNGNVIGGARPDVLSDQADVRTALDLARDEDEPEAVATTAGSRPSVLIAMPLYGSLPAPSDTSTRRQSLQGYAVIIEPPAALTGLPPMPPRSHLQVRLVAGSVTLYAYGSAGAVPAPGPRVANVTISGAQPTWAVVAWSSSTAPLLPWVILAGGLLLALAAAAIAAASLRAEAARAQVAISTADQMRLVARMGPLLQGSLDLGELLPTFVVEISDELDLDGVAIGLLSDGGRLVRAFALGSTSTALPEDLARFGRVPPRVAPGEEVVLPLQTGDRIIGALICRSRSGLNEIQLEALRGACELLAAALGNVRLFREEQEMVARLRELDRLKATFLGSVSHELRTMVTAVEGFAGLLVAQSERLTEAQRNDFLERIRRNARSLAVLVEDLLDFARLERSGLSVSLQEVDLSDLVPKIVDQTSSILAQRPVLLDIAPGVQASADPSGFERVLVNLLSNASKYTPEGTEVRVSLEANDGNAVLTVADRGPGVAPDERERIFELFYRIDNDAARAVRGVGIGLALVRQVVSLMNGTITASETPGGGATFTVTIPLVADPDAAAAADAADAAPAADGAPARAGTIASSN